MATKKQKRQAALEKRAEFEAEMRESGLKALHAERERREREARRDWQKQHDAKHFKFVDECPLCQDIRKNPPKEKPVTEKPRRSTLRMSPTPSVEETLGMERISG
jgi:hypothetical protein